MLKLYKSCIHIAASEFRQYIFFCGQHKRLLKLYGSGVYIAALEFQSRHTWSLLFIRQHVLILKIRINENLIKYDCSTSQTLLLSCYILCSHLDHFQFLICSLSEYIIFISQESPMVVLPVENEHIVCPDVLFYVTRHLRDTQLMVISLLQF